MEAPPTSAPLQASLLPLLLHRSGLPLHGDARRPGLFPRTLAGKKLATAALAAGLIEPDCPATKSGTAAGPFRLTGRGQQWLQEQADPKPVLEQLLAEVKCRRQDLIAAQDSLERCEQQLRLVAERIADCLPRVTATRLTLSLADGRAVAPQSPGQPGFECLSQHLLARLRLWAAEQPQADCPLRELYLGLKQQYPALTIGQFQDELRRLHGAGACTLQPWTGPLCELPEPTLALLEGHAVMYYAAPAAQLAAV